MSNAERDELTSLKTVLAEREREIERLQAFIVAAGLDISGAVSVEHTEAEEKEGEEQDNFEDNIENSNEDNFEEANDDYLDIKFPEGISEYEKIRLTNMAYNAKYLRDLGFPAKSPQPRRKRRRQPTPSPTTEPEPPLRVSKRPRDHQLSYAETTSRSVQEALDEEGEESNEDSLLVEDIPVDIIPALVCREIAYSSRQESLAAINSHRFGACSSSSSSSSACSSDALSFASILHALETVDIPEQDTRHNVRRDEDVRVCSISTGVVPSRSAPGIQLAVHSKRRPKLTRLLAAFGKTHIPEPDFCFNAITINKDFASALHTDRFNLGPSYIVALGDFDQGEGGELWAHDLGANDVHCQFLKFDGNIPHCTVPWTSGHRYSLVYYTNRLHSALGEFERKYLVEELGFPLCDPSVRGPLTIPRFHISVEEKVAAAAEAYREWEKEMEEGAGRASKRFETGTIDDDDDVCGSGGGRRTKNSMHASGNIKGKSIRDGSSSKETRISTPGVLCSGVEIGSKLVKFFSDRLGSQSWRGGFVGTVKYFQAPYFGVFYDDGDSEELELEEIASCGGKRSEHLAPAAAREFLRDHPEKRVQSVEVWRKVSGYVLAPVTLTADQLASLALKCSQKRQGGENKTTRGGARALEAANVERLMMREEAKQLKQLTTHVSKGGASSFSPLSSLSSSSSSCKQRKSASSSLDGAMSRGPSMWGDEEALGMGHPFSAVLATRSTADPRVAKRKGFEEEVLVQWSDPKEPDSWEFKSYVVLLPRSAPSATPSASEANQRYTVDVLRASTDQGVGLHLQIEPSVGGKGACIRVLQVKPDSPCHRVGIRPGDTVITLAEASMHTIKGIRSLKRLVKTFPCNFKAVLFRPAAAF